MRRLAPVRLLSKRNPKTGSATATRTTIRAQLTGCSISMFLDTGKLSTKILERRMREDDVGPQSADTIKLTFRKELFYPRKLRRKSARSRLTSGCIRTKRGEAHYCAVQGAACAVRDGGLLRQCRAASISASVAPWLRAHISAADAEYLAT